jgi:hypothetical protein
MPGFCDRCSLHSSHRRSCPCRLQVEPAVGAPDIAVLFAVLASVVLEVFVEAVQAAHSAVFRPPWKVSGARMSVTRRRSIQGHRQALPTAPESRGLFLGLRQTDFVALSQTSACSAQMLAALDQTDGAVVARERLLRSWEAVFGQMARGLAQAAECISVLRSAPSPGAHWEQALAVVVP